MEERRFEPGDAVIKEGATGDFFYVIGSGELEVNTRTVGGSSRKVQCSGGKKNYIPCPVK